MVDEGVATPSRQLRLAPVMTGGTSLAVWMGGVTSELYSVHRALREPDGSATTPIYRRLLEATRTEPVVDVITGTSAGGLNGTLLAMAVRLDLPLHAFAEARTTWMRAGDLDQLLRSPSESDPPSLLLGDDKFRAEVKQVLDAWRRAAPAPSSARVDPPPDVPVDLVTTYTRVNPIPVARVDDFDEGLNEVSFAGTLRFTHHDLDADDITERLAIAARTSASIPGVFEPSFLTSTLPDATTDGTTTDSAATGTATSGTGARRPDFARHQPPDVRGQSRWAVDGGLVVNLPLRYVLDRIFGQPSAGRVRRVVVYVSPTPSELGERRSDDPTDPPTIAASALTIINAPRAEGISSDVDAIRRANRTVAQQRTARRTIGTVLDPLGPTVPALYETYRAHRSRSSVDRMVTTLLRRFHGDRRFDEVALRETLLSLRPDLLPATADEFEGGDRPWGWGISTIEQAGSVVLGLVNQALDADARRRDTTRNPAVRAAALGRLKQRVHEHLRTVAEVRRLDEAFWARLIETTPVPATVSDHSAASDRAWIADRQARREHYAVAYREWPYLSTGTARGATPDDGDVDGDVEARRAAVFRRLREAHRGIAVALVAAAGEIETGGELADDELLAELRTFVPSGPAGFREQVTTAEQRLLHFHVVATLMMGDLTAREQTAELMQISFNAPNLLDPARSPADKLVGPELGRLGAFLKGSWRANDWFWGRMDGAARLARLLVDPARIWEVWSGADDGDDGDRDGDRSTLAARVASALGALDESTADAERAAIVAELDVLLGADDPAGCELPATTAAMIRRLQLAVARDELPNVRDAILDAREAGGNERGSRKFLEMMPATVLGTSGATSGTGTLDDEQVARLVTEMKIGAETARTELGSNLMVRTAVRTATVATNALTGTKSGLSAVQVPLRAVRAPLRVVSAVIGALTGASPLSRWLSALILGGAGAVLAVHLAGTDVNRLVLASAGVLFVGALVVALVRLGTVRFAVLFAVLSIPVVLALAGSSMRDVVYDQFDRTTVTVSPSMTVSEFRDATTVTVRPPETVRTGGRFGPSELTLDVDDDALVELLAGSERAVVTTEQHRPWWKSALVERHGGLPWAGWALAAAALALLAGAAIRLARPGRSDARRWPLAAAGTVLAVGAVLLGLWGEGLLTGPVRDHGRRQWVVARAEQLGDWRLEVLLVVLVGIGAAYRLGAATLPPNTTPSR
ncbi:MAG: patatin-like protein [Ilumatobacteraceae bacterium]